MKEAIEKLQFDPKWFECNFLDDEFLVRQIALFDEGDSSSGWQCTEHHRYFAFKTILSNTEILTDAQLENYIDLCQLDEDQAMAYAALGDLFEWLGLSSAQRQMVEDHPFFKDSGHLERIQHWRMLDDLGSRPCAEDLFEEIMLSGDMSRQLTLVASPHTSRPHLERLESEGRARKTRNMARNRLRGRQK